MVGLVVVSHSAKVAEGVVELARDMGGSDVRIAAAGGTSDPAHPHGTNPALIQRAIEQVYSDDGVIVLMDLGSAIMSAEIAIEQLPLDWRPHVILCEAPLVEGAITAASQARIGSPLDQVVAEARNALMPKATDLGEATSQAIFTPTATSPLSRPVGEMRRVEVRLSVPNRLGLHARPAARFVQTAGRFQADIQVSNLTTGRGPASAKSINGVAAIGARQGHDILLSADGPDADAALAALQALAGQNFGDVEETAAAPVERRKTKDKRAAPASVAGLSTFLQGLPASPGIVLGVARVFRPSMPEVPTHTIDDPQTEWDALAAALDKTRVQIQATRDAVARRAGASSAEIFEAHLLFLDDEALREPARRAIFDERLNAGAAWRRSFTAAADTLGALEDEYMRARASDILDIGRQVLLNLLGQSAARPAFAEPGILVAPDLAPADTVGLNPSLVLGICTAQGGPTSHSAILARTFGIPAVVGLGEGILALADGTPLILDGETGQVYPNPNAELSADYARRAEAFRRAQAEARAASIIPAITRDGQRVEIVANIGSAADAQVAVSAGAEGVGLFRTEFLFLDRRTAPDEDEQYAAYRAAAQAMGGRPVIVRTLDVGGDKPLPYLNLGVEANPFLGWRAIRMCLAHPDFFKMQLRAIVRTAAEFPTRVMFPMIATLGEWRAARSLLAEARAEVAKRGQVAPDRIDTGIMVEIPAAALRAAQFAPEVDFFSIGTNDLSQYTLAADRGNANVAALADPFHPAVLQLIQMVVEAAHKYGKWVGVCGEMGGDPLAMRLLVGLGVDELSMSAPAIPRAKQIIRTLELAKARKLAQAALELETAEAVRKMMNAE